MKNILACCVMVLCFGLLGTANAALSTIGTATYGGSDYNLIYEDDSIDGGLVWLDYANSNDTWQNQVNWASGLGSNLTVNLYPGYTTDIDWNTDWRLPLTQQETERYDQTNSELGHLYYVSLGNVALEGLKYTGEFTTLTPWIYWSETESSSFGGLSWGVAFFDGAQMQIGQWREYISALAVRPGQVSAVPIPSAIWLLGSGLIGLVGFRKKFRKA